jgi:enoyl-CoA hydratase/carnithine racemase
VTYEQIVYEARGEVALVTLDRPEKLNAWTPRMAVELAHAFERANAERGIGAIVVTGAGRGFCAGADMQDTFRARIDGVDPGENTAEGEGGMPKALPRATHGLRARERDASLGPAVSRRRGAGGRPASALG